ncbi:hypothetical protein EDI_121900 [Entamoeba dispar SAW760]|uniref:Uncharacterized protein n=1 Tax=Entamoeba dispar (strain ATCC PRA-260 / SAW760) TaxID=370354 RepID=B0EQC8_ENTDS|nr:uncharacterized protein EDI_121900 [Entamoeba dispar SAW760]EDR23253.1 hypothetical protein EDI_121900 [Entamoeba dispar SAW760]|eukprot:EDR23253.1 hypothetical protein EDI_121900 [Entamoeba dispar SAW760]
MQSQMDVELLFQNLLSSNNEIRSTAEKLYNSLFSQPNTLISIHIQALNSNDPNIRLLSANLLSRNFYKAQPSLYHYLTDEQKQQFKLFLIHLLQSDSPPALLRAYSSLLYDTFTVSPSFPELLPALKSMFTFPSPQHRSIALSTVALLIIFSEPSVDFIRESINSAIKLLNDVGIVVVSSLQLYKSIIEVCEEEGKEFTDEVVSHYPQFLEAAIRVLETDRLNAQSCIEIISEMNETSALFNNYLKQTCTFALLGVKLLGGDAIPSMECLAVLCETYGTLGDALLPTIQCLYQWLCTIQDNTEWYQFKEEEDSLCSAAEEFMFRFSFYKPTKEVLSLTPSNPTWQQARSFIFMVSQIVSADTSLYASIPQIYQSFLSIISLHPRVTYEVLVFANRVLKSYPSLRSTFEPVVCQLITTNINSPIPKIQARTCDFLSFFIDSASTALMKEKMESIISMLQPLLQSSELHVLSSAICAISFLVTRVQKLFTRYASSFLNGYFQLLNKIPTNYEYFELRGRIIESISIIGFYLNNSELTLFAQKLTEQLYVCLALPNIKVDDPLLGYIETIIIRMLPLLKEYFYPFITKFLPFLLQRCKIQIPIKNASGLSEEKKSAMGCLSVLISEAHKLLLPVMNQVIEIIVTESRSVNISIASIAINAAGSLFIILYQDQRSPEIELTLQRLVAVLDSGCHSFDAGLCSAGIGTLERIISHDIPLDSNIVMSNIAAALKHLEQFREVGKVTETLLSALSTSIVLGSMNSAYTSHIHPIILEKLKGSSSSRVVAMRVLKIAIRDGGLKTPGIVRWLNDSCIAVRDAAISVLVASFERGFENSEETLNSLWKMVKEETNEYVQSKAVRKLGRIILDLKLPEQANEWLKYLPIKKKNEKLCNELCLMYINGLINLEQNHIPNLLIILADNFLYCSHTKESLIRMKQVLTVVSGKYDSLTKQCIQNMSLERKDALNEIIST